MNADFNLIPDYGFNPRSIPAPHGKEKKSAEIRLIRENPRSIPPINH